MCCDVPYNQVFRLSGLHIRDLQSECSQRMCHITVTCEESVSSTEDIQLDARCPVR